MLAPAPFLRDREEAEARHQSQLGAAQERGDSLDAELRASREARLALEARAAELALRLGTAEGSNK